VVHAAQAMTLRSDSLRGIASAVGGGKIRKIKIYNFFLNKNYKKLKFNN
jgi:hypothetical protein